MPKNHKLHISLYISIGSTIAKRTDYYPCFVFYCCFDIVLFFAFVSFYFYSRMSPLLAYLFLFTVLNFLFCHNIFYLIHYILSYFFSFDSFSLYSINLFYFFTIPFFTSLSFLSSFFVLSLYFLSYIFCNTNYNYLIALHYLSFSCIFPLYFNRFYDCFTTLILFPCLYCYPFNNHTYNYYLKAAYHAFFKQ